MLVWKTKSSAWKLEFWTDQKIRLNDKSSGLETYFLPGPDELSLQRIKNLKIDKQKLWLVHDFCSKTGRFTQEFVLYWIIKMIFFWDSK